MNDEDEIIVCDQCLRACCWYGELMCEDAIVAGTIKKTIKELKKLNSEHSDYWKEQL